MNSSPSVRCPEFLPGVTWLNTPRPLSVREDLRGRVAILDFWTYCCINCVHVLPVLRRIEERFAAQPVAVIGVHSAKFLTEKDPENIRRAIARNGIRHPVVVDSDHELWQRFAVRAWPTLVIVDAAGYVRETLSGEIEEAPLAARVQALLDEGRERGGLAPGAIDLGGGKDEEAGTGLLRFPGRVLAGEGRVFISDSGHNRILVCDARGQVEAVIGEGGVGAHDGPARHASFHDPQGLAIVRGALCVADRGNHMIRAVDLDSLEVRTLAGTGEKGRGGEAFNPAAPREAALRSPWGLAASGDHLIIAMAGSHQLWVYDFVHGAIGAWAGTGREAHVDGPLDEACFAQPSGLSMLGNLLCVADSEVSSVRVVDVDHGLVRTLAGRGLFDFGDRDGRLDRALLQHPLDVAAAEDRVYVADTYNHKIKEIRLATLEIATLFGGEAGETLLEPGGLAVGDGALYIADTNHHRILKGDLAGGGLEPFKVVL